MYGKIELKGKELELMANAATPFRVKQIFGIDIMKSFLDSQHDDGLSASSVLPELAFVMNAQALKKDMSKLNMESFFEWCEDFGAFELVENAQQILDIYLGNQIGSSEAKKNKDR